MIDLYAWCTPNGYKVSILLEELAMPYRVIPVDISAGDQFEPWYLKLNPNNKIPAIVDSGGPGGAPYTLFESGAILLYLADKAGRFLPRETRARFEVIQWLMFQMGSLGPMLGQNHHFRQYAPERIGYAVERYTNEARRLYNVMDRVLADREWIAGPYSIADMAIYPWLRAHERQGVDLAACPHVARWYRAMEARPAVPRGIEAVKKVCRARPMDERSWEVMFGATQYARR